MKSMQSIKQALCGLLVAGCAATSAFATPIYDHTDTVFVVADDNWSGTMQTWQFGAGEDGVLAGQTFAYQFVFNTPPAFSTTFFQFWVDGAPGVKFGAAGFYLDDDVMLPAPDFTIRGNPFELNGKGWLDNGPYDLYLRGTFLADGAGFRGFAMDTETASDEVPEPATLGLLAAGVAGLLGARRRGARPAMPATIPC
jgi:hypothetical protein